MKYQNLEFGKYYHIYDRGNNRENIFLEDLNYMYFLKLFDKHISPIAEVFCYCLLKNHFHFLLRIKDLEEINLCTKVSQTNQFKEIKLWQSFSNFFNAYSKAFNKRYKRTGSLFQYKFKRKEITDESYFYRLVHYIHFNPIKHHITDNYKSYKYSSYQAIIGDKPTKIKKDKVLQWFENKQNFIECHKLEVDEFKIRLALIED
jgi:putative transposase